MIKFFVFNKDFFMMDIPPGERVCQNFNYRVYGEISLMVQSSLIDNVSVRKKENLLSKA